MEAVDGVHGCWLTPPVEKARSLMEAGSLLMEVGSLLLFWVADSCTEVAGSPVH